MKIKSIFLVLVLIACDQSVNAEKFSDIDWFKKRIEDYKDSNGSLQNFPLWNYFEFPEYVRFALQEGVKGDIHTLSNAMEINNVVVISLILENNPAIIDEYYHAKYEDSLKKSVRYIARSITQEAAYALNEEVFYVLLKHNPNRAPISPAGETIDSILKYKESIACASTDAFDEEKNRYYSDCQKAKRMMAALFKK